MAPDNLARHDEVDPAPHLKLIENSEIAHDLARTALELVSTDEPVATREEISGPGWEVEYERQYSQGSKFTARDSIGQYLHEIGLRPLLTNEQEVQLSKQVQIGVEASKRLADETLDLSAADRVTLKRAARAGKHAKDIYIEANLRLVVSIARRYPLPPGMDLLDLIQEGNLGLEHAVEKFDWRKGFKFSTYATFWIRQAVGRALETKANLIRLPNDQALRLRSAMRNAEGDTDNLDDETARLHRLTTPTSLDRRVSEDSEQELVDLIPDNRHSPEDESILNIMNEQAMDVLNRLEPRDREALKMRYGFFGVENKSFRTIAEALGVTPEGARRIVLRAEARLREKGQELRSF